VVINQSAILSVNNSMISGNAANPTSRFGTGGGIYNSGTTTITDSTLSDNTGGSGGAVNINAGGTLNLIRSTVSGNTATASSTSGGIDNASGILNVINSTISGNFTNGTDGNNGGGIRTSRGSIIGRTTLINATITNNSADGPNSASGVINANGTVNVKNTIIAANAGNTTVPDVFGSFASQGYNFIGNADGATGFTSAGDQTGTLGAPLDPKLATLADNGGATRTHALLAGSPALDKGAAATDPITSAAITTDQRGLPRPVDLPDANYPNEAGGNGSDIGAFEAQTAPTGPTAASVSVSGRVMTASGRGIRNVLVRLIDEQRAARIAVTSTFGYYRFADVPAGRTYTISISTKSYNFNQPSQLLSLVGETGDVNFVADN
jgi:hypothetical protein